MSLADLAELIHTPGRDRWEERTGRRSRNTAGSCTRCRPRGRTGR